jgi:hypothetical protein
MKRIKTIAVVLGMALLCFAAVAMAGESSFYDTVNNWLVRVYTVENLDPTGAPTGTYSVYMEFLNDNGDDIVQTEGLSEILKNGEIPSEYPILICNCAVNDQISLAHKFVASGTEVFAFDTHASGIVLHNNTIISRNNPAYPSISVSGNGVFGNVDIDATPPTRNFIVTNTGDANSSLTLGTVTFSGTGFSRIAGGCANGQTLAKDGSCTITMQFDPTTAGAYSGHLYIPSNDSDTATYDVPLSGTGTDEQQTGTADLIITSVSGPTAASNNSTVRLTIYVKNQGTGSAGPSKVKTTKGTAFLLDFDVPSIAAGQTVSVTGTYLLTCPVHATYYLYSNADGYLQVSESNENNNQRVSIITCNR